MRWCTDHRCYLFKSAEHRWAHTVWTLPECCLVSSVDIDEPQRSLKTAYSQRGGADLGRHYRLTYFVFFKVLMACTSPVQPLLFHGVSFQLPSQHMHNLGIYSFFHHILNGFWSNSSSWSLLLQFPLLLPVQTRVSQSCIISVDFPAPNCCPLTNSSQASACSCLLGFDITGTLLVLFLHRRTSASFARSFACFGAQMFSRHWRFSRFSPTSISMWPSHAMLSLNLLHWVQMATKNQQVLNVLQLMHMTTLQSPKLFSPLSVDGDLLLE